MPEEQRTLTVRVERNADACGGCHLGDDEDVEGDYFIPLSRHLSDPDAASTALDQFHYEVAIDTLDYFSFTVLDEQGRPIAESPDHEAYSAVGHASVC